MEPTTDPERIVEIINELLDEWDDLTSAGELSLKPRRSKTYPQAATILALTAHVHESVRALLPNLPHGLTAVNAPIARSALESALTVMWIDRKPDAAAAFTNENARQRRAIATRLREAGDHAQAARVVHVDDPEWATAPDSKAEARQFEQLAKALGANDLYLMYRILCGLTHASPGLADEYLNSGGDLVPFHFSPKPTPIGRGMSASLTWLLAACLLWSARRVDYLDGRNSRRSGLRAHGRELGTDPDAGSK